MIYRNTLVRRFLLSLSLVGSVLLAGCSDDGLGKRFPVSGQVTYKGEPLASGEITFMPDKPDGRGAAGKIKDGYYTMTTQDPGDGAFPGTYSVLITALDINMAQADADTKKAADKNKMTVVMPDQAAVAKAVKSAKNMVPQKYSSIDTSGLKATVEQKSNTIPFALTD